MLLQTERDPALATPGLGKSRSAVGPIFSQDSQKTGESQARKMLSAEEERALVQAWLDRDDYKARNDLVLAFTPLVKRIARGIKSSALSHEELFQAGVVGLIQSLDRFDPKLGFRVSTFARWSVLAAMQDAVTRQIERPKVETSSKTGPRERGRTVSMEFQVCAADGDTTGELSDVVADKRLADIRGDLLEQREQDFVDRALCALDGRERFIMEARCLADHPRTLGDLSGELGVSAERVRQIEARARRRIRPLVDRDSSRNFLRGYDKDASRLLEEWCAYVGGGIGTLYRIRKQHCAARKWSLWNPPSWHQPRKPAQRTTPKDGREIEAQSDWRSLHLEQLRSVEWLDWSRAATLPRSRWKADFDGPTTDRFGKPVPIARHHNAGRAPNGPGWARRGEYSVRHHPVPEPKKHVRRKTGWERQDNLIVSRKKNSCGRVFFRTDNIEQYVYPPNRPKDFNPHMEPQKAWGRWEPRKIVHGQVIPFPEAAEAHPLADKMREAV